MKTKIKDSMQLRVDEIRYLSRIQIFIASLFKIPYVRKYRYSYRIKVEDSTFIQENDLVLTEDGNRWVATEKTGWGIVIELLRPTHDFISNIKGEIIVFASPCPECKCHD